MAKFMRPTHKNPYYRFGDGYTPLMKSDFAPPPKPTVGDKTPRTLWESVGKALSRWSIVEREFSITFHILVQSQTHSSWRALGAIISFKSQLEVIEGAAEQCFQPKSNKTFQNIRTKINIAKRASERRNEFAHGHVVKFLGAGHFLVPSLFDRRKVTLGKLAPESMKYCYISSDIRALSDKFRFLDRELFNLNTDLLKAIHKKYPLTRPLPDLPHPRPPAHRGTNRPKLRPPHITSRG